MTRSTTIRTGEEEAAAAASATPAKPATPAEEKGRRGFRPRTWNEKGPFVDSPTWPQMWLKYVNSANDDHDANLKLTSQGEYIAIQDVAVGEE